MLGFATTPTSKVLPGSSSLKLNNVRPSHFSTTPLMKMNAQASQKAELPPTTISAKPVLKAEKPQIPGF